MDTEQIEEKIREILYGKSIVDIADSQFFIRSLTGKEDSLVRNAHRQAIIEGQKMGLLTQVEMQQTFRERGVWTVEDDDRIESLRAHLNKLNNIVEDYKYNKARYNSIKTRIRKHKRELEELELAHRNLFLQSLEYRAQEIKFRRIAFYCLETLDENPYWTLEDFKNCDDFTFINTVVDKYVKTFILGEAVVRELARNAQWRYRWVSTKNGADLFGKPACEWSEAQNGLVYWSLYYDNVFEDPDCPFSLINNDEALDRWLRNKRKERRQSKDVLKSSKSRRKNFADRGTEETFIFTPQEDRESIEEIQAMNDSGTRARLRTERKVLEKERRIGEWGLRKGIHIGISQKG